MKEFIEPWPDHGKIRAFFYNRRKNLEEIKQTLPADVRMISLKQIHSNRVFNVVNPSFDRKEGDGAVTRLSKVALTVHTADCLPLLAFEGDVIGSCHAGWRGLSQGIIENWIDEMVKAGAFIKNLALALGPAIGPCHFEVGKDVSKVLSQGVAPGTLEKIVLKHPDKNKEYVDLIELAIWRLRLHGIPEKNIVTFKDCTYCDEDLYYSYRRDGAHNGRLEGVIYKL